MSVFDIIFILNTTLTLYILYNVRKYYLVPAYKTDKIDHTLFASRIHNLFFLEHLLFIRSYHFLAVQNNFTFQISMEMIAP